MTWKEFVQTHPVRSIALDSYIKGEPRFNREGTHVNFNHHEDIGLTPAGRDREKPGAENGRR
jgi:hypothetical protein